MTDLDSVYGRFVETRPEDAAELLAGFAPWWIGGGWAIEAFTGVQRPHEDIDVCVFGEDAARLVAHFEGTHHVWAVGSGMMKPMLSADEIVPDWAGQFWIREDATTPWLLDVLLTPGSRDTWVFKRDETVSFPLATATWVSEGIRYERPDIALLFKAKHDRPKDREDLRITLPLLEPDLRDWFLRTLTRLNPEHPWIDLISAPDPR